MSSQGLFQRTRSEMHPLRRTWLSLLVAAALAPQAQAADLLTITRDALENNAALASSRSIYDSVEATRDIQRADLLPQVSASAGIARNDTFESQQQAGNTAGSSDDGYNGANVSIEATQAIFDATNWYQYRQTTDQIDQQALVLEGDRQQLIYNVTEAYFEILRARDVLEARIAQERAIERQLEQAREQFEVGLIAITDVHEAQASFDQARAQRIAAKSDLQISFEALEQLTGKDYETINGLTEELPVESPKPSSRDAWVALALENYPALLASQEAVEISRSDVDIAQAGYLPTLDAYAQYNFSDTDQDNVTGHNSGSEVGLSATLPIFTGGRTSAQVNQATYLLESAQYDFESERRSTVQQVRSLFTQVVNDVQTVEAQRQAIISSRSALEATRSGYEVGTRNIVDVLSAEQDLYDALANYAEARYAYVIDMIALRQQAGVLDTSNVRALNDWLREDDAVRLELQEGEQASGMSIDLDIGAPPRPPQ
ncbi:TolC family outer membrane protein [Modicisalibacter luteus]|uniref:TolC family outer membrane protein n=1 Tax=Modicisalibacter luteus TaxID=453962 RepID=A0ABV7M188_9GAMM|nr:TolC family outer membrane protein [Halomonas lutea]GHB08419.1 channel protein TolC [Halomonas lutea]